MSEHETVTFSIGDESAVDLAIERLPFKYPMELREADMETVIRALNQYALSDLDDWDSEHSAQSLLGSIFTTLNVEVV